MARFNNKPLEEIIGEELERQYLQALTYAVGYGSGWAQAEHAFTRLQAFRQGLKAREEAAVMAAQRQYRKAA